jgi:hypothetical protein
MEARVEAYCPICKRTVFLAKEEALVCPVCSAALVQVEALLAAREIEKSAG